MPRPKNCAGVATYSALYGSWGAVLLTVSQLAVALVLLHLLPKTIVSRGTWWAEVIGATPMVAAASVFAIRRTVLTARLFRGTAGAFLLAFYLLLIGNCLTK